MINGKLYNYGNYSKFVIDEDLTFLVSDGGNDLSRLITTFKNGAMVISACRDEFDKKENLKRTLELKSDLKAKNLGFRPSAGGFIENIGTENEIAVEELSFIVPYNKNQMSEQEFFDIAVELCNKYGQESVLIMLPSLNNAKPFWVDKSGNNVQNFEKDFRLAKKTDYYTRPLKHHTPGFTYEFEKIDDSVESEYNLLANFYGTNHLLVGNNSLKRKEYDKDGWSI